MSRWCTLSISKRMGLALMALGLLLGTPLCMAAEAEREPVSMRVTAVNPSADKTQKEIATNIADEGSENVLARTFKVWKNNDVKLMLSVIA